VSATVHPHVCGEHNTMSAFAPAISGSSPRVWGTFSPTGARQVIHRFIPTCVGNISCIQLNLFTLTVHPHVCGEHESTNAGEIMETGSSPRVWGTSSRRDGGDPQLRFIPTCVGNI